MNTLMRISGTSRVNDEKYRTDSTRLPQSLSVQCGRSTCVEVREERKE